MNRRSITTDSGALYRGIKNLLRCDEAEVVRGIARYVVSQHRALRLLSALIERTKGTPVPGVIALIGWLRSFLSVRGVPHQDGVVWIARLRNERRAIEEFSAQLSELCWTNLKFQSWPDAAALSGLVRHLSPRRIFRLTRRLHRRYEFFKVLRIVEFIGFWSRYVEIFRAANFQLAVMSSHSNPHGVAFNLAARRCGVPVVLITHGMPIKPVARLHYGLAVVHCDAARQTYADEGSRMDRVLIHGRRRDYAPMKTALPPRLAVGIFLCKDVNEKVLQALAARLLDHPQVSRILIRPHPKNLWRGLDAWIASVNAVASTRRVNDSAAGLSYRDNGDQAAQDRLLRSVGGSVQSDLETVDIVLAGNSSVLVDAVTGGRPSAYVANLDHGSPDLHAFVARGLIYELKDFVAGRSFNPEAMLCFYQQPEWPATLRLFANIDEDEQRVAMELGLAMRDLMKSIASE